MREYETVLIVQPEISDDGVAEVTGRIDGVLEQGGAVRLLYDDLGKRRMAYEIQNFQKGRYIVLQFLDKGAVVADLERALRLEDSILRYLTVQIEEEVVDVDGRKARAEEEERIRAEKAKERAEREAAEEVARQEAEAAAREAAAAEAATAAAAAEAAEAEAAVEGAEGADDASDESPEAKGGDSDAGETASDEEVSE